jgi:hypothetical protein
MRRKLCLALIGLIAIALDLAACNESSGVAPSGDVDDVSSLVTALRQAGATVELGGSVSQPFVAVTGQIVRVNGEDVQVFVYPTRPRHGPTRAGCRPTDPRSGRRS